jgi:mannose-6-phosphate isomerase-like protein (cupin superfamily)
VEKINGCTVISPADTAEALTWGEEETGGSYRCLIGTIPAEAPAPPLHRHPTTDETFYVAQGQAKFRLGDEEITAEAGTLVFVPRGTVHTAWGGNVDTQGLIIISPADVEHEFVPVEDR